MDWKKFGLDFSRFLLWNEKSEFLDKTLQTLNVEHYNGVIYRGLCWDTPTEVKSSGRFVSWSTNREVAEYFASHGRYQRVISRRASSKAVSVHSILKLLKENEACPAQIQNYSFGREEEVLDIW